MHRDDQKYIEQHNANRNRILKNHIYLITILNAITLFMFIFAMSYYKWFYMEIKYIDNNGTNQVSLWVNLLYTYDNISYKYASFAQTKINKCDEFPNSPFQQICESILEQLNFIGIFVFTIILFANVLQIYDVGKMLYHLVIKGHGVKKSDSFRHIFTVCTFLLGMSIYLFSTFIMKNISNSHLGLCFYFTFGCILLFILAIIYEQISIRRIIKQDLVNELLSKYEEDKREKSDRFSSESFIL